MTIALLNKELRENAKWAALLVLLLLGAMAWAIQPSSTAADVPPLNPAMAAVCMIGFALAGIALGLLAVLPDARLGRWQFVMHRPVSRGRIFRAKLLAATLLYLAATAIPLAAAIGWCAAPGHVAGPFTAGMILPRLADLLGGWVWLAAALLVAGRSARWLGSRLAPLALACLAVLIALSQAMRFWQFVLILVPAAAILLIGARAAFVAAGAAPRRAWIGRLTVAIAVYAGCMMFVLMAMGLLAASEALVHPPRINNLGSRSYVVLDDGRIVISDNSRGGATDLQGRPLPDALDLFRNHSLPQATLLLTGARPQDQDRTARVEAWGFHSQASHVRPMTYGQANAPRRWFFVAARNGVEEYDASTRRYLGSLGPAGWSPSPQPFPQKLIKVGYPYTWSTTSAFTTIVSSDCMVWKLSLDHPHCQLLFAAPPGQRVIDASEFEDASRDEQERGPLNVIVLTDRGFEISSPRHATVRFAASCHAPQYQQVSVGRTLGGQLVVEYSPAWNGQSYAGPRVIQYLDAAGQPARRLELPNIDVGVSSDTVFGRAIEALAAPPVLEVIDTWSAPAGPALSAAMGWIICGIEAVACAWLGFVLARRRLYGRAACVEWAALCLPLGISGVLLLISMDSAPPRLICPACHHRRPVTLPLCPHCGAPFPPPPMLRIELFDPLPLAGA